MQNENGALQPEKDIDISAHRAVLSLVEDARQKENLFRKEQRRSFGNWLRVQRTALGLSQEKAGEEAKLSTNTWYRIEAGIVGTRKATVPRIAHAVQADLNETYRQAGFLPPEDNRNHNVVTGNSPSFNNTNVEIVNSEEIPMLRHYILMMAGIDARLARIERALGIHDDTNGL